MNPWVKGYKVAFIYNSTGHGYAKELDAKLAEDIGRDNVFNSDVPEFKVRLSGTDLSRALPEIYKKSEILVAFLGKEEKGTSRLKSELPHILWAIHHACSVFLINEKDAEIPKWLKFNLWNQLDPENINEIVQQIEREIGEERVATFS